MSLRTQTFYPRLGLSALAAAPRPAAYFAAGQAYALGRGPYARYLAPQPGAAQKQVTQTWLPVADGAQALLLCAQSLSDPLARQSIAVGVWTVGFGVRVANAANASPTWRGYAALYVVQGATGAIRGTLFQGAVGNFGFLTTETTVFGTFLGAAAEVVGGDCLLLELGIEVDNQSGVAWTPQATLFCDGATPITATGVAVASARSFVFAPAPLAFSLPQLGEPPTPSYSFERAKAELRGLLPGNTPHNFDKPTSADAQFLAWHAEVLKAYLWDLLDLVERELNPARAILKLADWVQLYLLPATSSVEQTRAFVLARLREFGPASPYNVAASIGTLLGYAKPSQLQILTLSAADLRTALELVDTPASPRAIPQLANFTGALTLRMPFTRDGGAIWGVGAFLTLVLNQPDGEGIHARLTSPDGRQKVWSPITRWDPIQTLTLYGAEFAGGSAHGTWTLELYRTSVPAVSLAEWRVFAPGAPFAQAGVKRPVPVPTGNPPFWPLVFPNAVRDAGMARWKFWWGAYADPLLRGAVSPADLREARAACGRLRHAYEKGDLLLTLTPIPDDPATLPDSAVPT